MFRARLAHRISALVLVLAAAQMAEAQDRAVVAGPLPRGLWERIQGQTGDLDFEVLREEALAPGATPLDRARGAARPHRARVVVWVESERRGPVLHIADVPASRLLVREVAATRVTSATLETLAVIVRSSLQALALGGEIGVVVVEPEPPPPPPAAEPVAPPGEEPPTPEPPPPPTEPSTPTLLSAVGWELSVDGQSPLQHGPAGLVGVQAGRFGVAASVAVSLGADLDDGLVRVRLTRQAARLHLSALLLDGEVAQLGLALTGGAVAFRRTATAAAEGVRASGAATTWAGLVGLELSLALFPPGVADGRFGVLLRAGAEAVPGVVELAVRQGDVIAARNRLWNVQPFAGAALVLRTGGGG